MTAIDSGNVCIEDCQRVDFLKFHQQAKKRLIEALLASEISVPGVILKLSTSKTGNGGTRYWFTCPTCGRRAGVLYVHPVSPRVGCRTCLGLKYRSQRFKGMPEAL